MVSLGPLFVFGLLQAASPDSGDLQRKVNSCVIGQTSMDTVVQMFGKPSKVKKGMTWYFKGTERRMQEASYPALGLTFTILSNPSELYNIEITNPSLSVQGIRVGTSLEDVIKALGEGTWLTSQGSPTFRLTYEKKGLRFEFARDPKAPQFPMKLLEPPVVVKVVRYDGRISFS